jgi:hypothetical protein
MNPAVYEATAAGSSVARLGEANPPWADPLQRHQSGVDQEHTRVVGVVRDSRRHLATNAQRRLSVKVTTDATGNTSAWAIR